MPSGIDISRVQKPRHPRGSTKKGRQIGGPCFAPVVSFAVVGTGCPPRLPLLRPAIAPFVKIPSLYLRAPKVSSAYALTFFSRAHY